MSDLFLILNSTFPPQIMKYKIPQHLLDFFGSEAVKNSSVETLALCLGQKKEDEIWIEELIFPSQSASSTHVEDLGINGQETTLWIPQNSSCFKKHRDTAVYAMWIHSHVQGNKCFFFKCGHSYPICL